MNSQPAVDRVVALEEHHVEPVADLLSHAMDVDAAYQYLFPRAAARQRGLENLFARNLSIHRAHRCTYVALDRASRVIGTVTMRPPQGIHISTATMLRHGLLPFALRHGAASVGRLLWLKETYDRLERELAEGRRHWHVHMMAVAPELQGRGVGAALLKHVIDATVRTTSDTEVVLTTHLPRNVVFYRRAEFDVRWERSVQPPDAPSWGVWGMVRR